MKSKLIISALMISSCSNLTSSPTKVEAIQIKETFTSTQKYEILCWVVKKAENYRKGKYLCQAKKETVGWGFTFVKSVRDIHHADEIFQKLISKLYNDVSVAYPDLTYFQKASIISLYYNTGDLNMIKDSNFSKHLVNKDIDKSILQFKKWCKVKVKNKYVFSKGLYARRSYESKLIDGSFNMDDYIKLRQEIQHIYTLNKTL
jgi:GH24 family phage-related lysozyme (muramidase)